LQLFSVNEEFLVSTISSECADYVPVLCTHRPSLLPIECFSEIFGLVFRAALGSFGLYRKDAQTGSFRGSKSRNKVFVGEPAYGSLPYMYVYDCTISCIIITYTTFSLRIIIIYMYDNYVAPLCQRTSHRTSLSYVVYVLFETFPYIQQNHCCLSLNMNRIYIFIQNIINKKIILYGGSLGSLFDEERSKVRESNANCRTH
jgi:hypothetical protein